ncbi:MAG TPA: nucleotide sugar dehydrogenase [Holophagaceae bacterium]|nr:nucleotide sugar dehydrogenase [Holophagaceae bacterium]
MTPDLCVLGLGYIGLPTSVLFAQAGLRVHGVDVDPRKLELLARGECPIHEAELPERLKGVIDSGHLTVGPEPVPSKTFLLCVPSPVTEDRKADLSFVEATTRMIAPVLEKGNLVILETTVPPGTCRQVIAPILQELRGWNPDTDYLLAHAPERVIPGAIFKELTGNARVVGGVTPEASRQAAELYRRAGVREVHETTADVAELAKVVENTYRDVNIAFANELAAICRRLGVDVFDTIRLANLHPRVNVHTPGIGVGGHCIPVDPWFLIHLCPDEAQIVRTARAINDAKPHQVVDDILAAHGRGNIAPIGILGLTYKPDVDDIRESPALEVVYLLERAHRTLRIFDPLIPERSTATLEEVCSLPTVAVLTDHRAFQAVRGPKVLRWNRP